MHIRLALVPMLACALVAGTAGSATAAPTRAPLGPQVLDGLTLHPSGRDRYDEAGLSGAQGKAQADPDGDHNYGIDQFPAPGDPMPGGGLYTIDQDGNNGCGNDQDFEDDNNGLCGGARTLCPVADSSVTQSPGDRGPAVTRSSARMVECSTSSEPTQSEVDGSETTVDDGSWSVAAILGW